MRNHETDLDHLVGQLGAEADPATAYRLLTSLKGTARRVRALRKAYGRDWSRIGAVLSAGEKNVAPLDIPQPANYVPKQRENSDMPSEPQAQLPPVGVEDLKWTPSTCIEGQLGTERPDDVAERRHGHDAR